MLSAKRKMCGAATDRACAAIHQDASLVDVQRRVVDARVIVLGAFEHNGPRLDAVVGLRLGRVGLAEGFPTPTSL